ncbi:MAG: hypothetical protein H6673_16750 [Anaerolineales bacterium]|nr:hypothetical protein [Anaerolineales bacterium]
MAHHPATRLILKQTTIIRDRLLPPHVYGRITVKIDDEVTARKVVAQGEASEEFRIVDIVEAMGLDPSDSDKIAAMIRVGQGETVEAGDLLIEPRNRRQKKRGPKAPANGVVSLIENGRIILQIDPKPVVVYARVPGVVQAPLGEDGERGVQIRTQGALIQGAWGNGRFAFAPYNMEPTAGLISLRQHESLLESIKGQVYVLERPITPADLRIVVEKELGGLVAPSMPFYLRETAMMLKVPIILTEGFGQRKPTTRAYEILREFERQREGAFDATMPERWQRGRPEIVLPAGLVQPPPPPNLQTPLKVGATVRLRREPYDGLIGQVVALPDTLRRLENGLQVQAADIKLRIGSIVTVPLANLEVLGD